jgi:hypothetical protein
LPVDARFYLSEVPIDNGAEMPKHALLVKADLSYEGLDIAESELKKLQTAVDGLIQPVDIGDTVTMWVNEEGLLRGDLRLNHLATMLMEEIGYKTPIMGDVVFTGAPDEDGNTMEFPAQASYQLIELIDSFKAVMEQAIE